MVLKQVFKQAGRHSHPQVRICVSTPFPRKAPNLVRVLLDVLSNVYECLPSRVWLPFGGFLAWQDLLRFPYRLVDGHTTYDEAQGSDRVGSR